MSKKQSFKLTMAGGTPDESRVVMTLLADIRKRPKARAGRRFQLNKGGGHHVT